MNYRIKITREAKAEILSAKNWYEEQQPGLGHDFAQTVKQHIDSLITDKVEHKVVFDAIRRMLVKRFPYVIYYSRNESTETVIVLAVLHERQQRKL